MSKENNEKRLNKSNATHLEKTIFVLSKKHKNEEDYYHLHFTIFKPEL